MKIERMLPRQTDGLRRSARVRRRSNSKVRPEHAILGRGQSDYAGLIAGSGADMVSAGMPWALTPHSSDYVSDEKQAIGARLGVHAHEFEKPWDWRGRRGLAANNDGSRHAGDCRGARRGRSTGA